MLVLTRPRFTHDDLLETPDDDGPRYEIIDGELIVSAAPRRGHQRFLFLLTLRVGPHVEERKLGHVYFAPVDVKFSEEDLVQPDLLFIRADRLDIYMGSTVYGPPDLVVENLSPSTRARDRLEKFDLYQRNGVPEYRQADPEAPSLTVFALNAIGRYERLAPAGRFLRSRVLPELVLDLEELFADL